jgi:hypothetical protein
VCVDTSAPLFARDLGETLLFPIGGFGAPDGLALRVELNLKDDGAGWRGAYVTRIVDQTLDPRLFDGC